MPPADHGVEIGSPEWQSYQGSTPASLYGGAKAATPLQQQLAPLKSLLDDMVRERKMQPIRMFMAEREAEAFRARQKRRLFDDVERIIEEHR